MTTVEVLTSNPSGKLPPWDKTLQLNPDIHFYDIEDSNNIEEGEES